MQKFQKICVKHIMKQIIIAQFDIPVKLMTDEVIRKYDIAIIYLFNINGVN